MDSRHLLELLADNPVIAAVKDDQGLESALAGSVDVIFLLYGNILNLSELVDRVRAAGKAAFVHLDLADGLTNREIAADFVARRTAAAGIISTRSPLVKRGRELGLVSVQRFFLLDSMALENIEKDLARDASDLIEVLPGLMPKMIRRLVQDTGKPVIAGGLISDKEDVTGALGAGAVAVCTTHPAVWSM